MLTALISLASILLILIRPFDLPEWIWAVLGSLSLLIFHQIEWSSALHAIAKGGDVYFFLIGMMLLSEQARESGIFEWLASWTVMHAKGSAKRLFILIYLAGIAVTAFLSNDATAVVMTPAVYAAVKKAGAHPRPYLFACALIANAASFLLPISNPANLVVFSSHLPKMTAWIALFGWPSFLSIGITYFVLAMWFRKSISSPLSTHQNAHPKLKREGKFTLTGLILVTVILLVVSAIGWQLGLPTLLASLLTVTVIAIYRRKFPNTILKNVSWGIVPLVAGLFILVEASQQIGSLADVQAFLHFLEPHPDWVRNLGSAFGVGLVSNLINNLPMGLLGGMAVNQAGIREGMKNAVLIGIDLGPNLSVTGSLATLLWLSAIRRENERVSAFEFFKLGLIAMPLALIGAVLALR